MFAEAEQKVSGLSGMDTERWEDGFRILAKSGLTLLTVAELSFGVYCY